MDAYVYVETEPGTARRVAEDIARLDVREVVVVTGPYDVVVSLENVDPFSLGETVLDHIQAVAGVVRTNSAIVVDPALVSAAPWPTFPFHFAGGEVTALVHVLIQPGTTGRVLEGLSGSDAIVGWALLAGDWDILVEVSAPTWDDASRVVLEQIQPIEGIARTSTYLAISPKLKAEQASAKGTRARQ